MASSMTLHIDQLNRLHGKGKGCLLHLRRLTEKGKDAPVVILIRRDIEEFNSRMFPHLFCNGSNFIGVSDLR